MPLAGGVCALGEAKIAAISRPSEESSSGRVLR